MPSSQPSVTVTPTTDGMGYWVSLGDTRAFTSSMHLVPDKEAQLLRNT